MSAYVLVLFVHIAAGVLLLGTSILGEPAVRAAARRARAPGELTAYLHVGRQMAALGPVAALTLLASGVYLTHVGRFWSMGWLQVSLAFWLVNAVLAVAVVKAAIERVAAETSASPDGSIDGRLDALRWSSAWTWGVDTMAATDAAVLYLMTVKPTLAGSLAVVLLANAAVAVGRLAFGPQRPRVAAASFPASGRSSAETSG